MADGEQKVEMENQIYAIPEHLMKGSGTEVRTHGLHVTAEGSLDKRNSYYKLNVDGGNVSLSLKCNTTHLSTLVTLI